MALGQLVVKLGLDAAEFTQGMSKAEADAYKFGEGIGKKLNAYGAAAAITAIGTAAVAAFAVLNQQVEAIASFKNLSEKIGDTAENLASLKKASDVSGVSMDNIAAASIKLTTALSKTDEEGMGAANAIKALGLDFNAFKALSPVDQIESVSKAMAGFEDGAGKTAVAVGLWGKAGADMIPLLNDLAEGSERQITLTGEQIKAADDFSKSMARLGSDASTLKQQIVAGLIPTLQDLLNIYVETANASDGAGGKLKAFGGVAESIRGFIKDTTAATADLVGALSKLMTIGGGFAQFAKKLLSGDIAGADQTISDTAAALKAKNKFYSDLAKGIGAAGNPTSDEDLSRGGKDGKPKLTFNGIKPKKAASGGGAEKLSEADKYLENLQKQLEATKNLTVEEALQRDIKKGALGVLVPAQQAELVALAQKIDLYKQGVKDEAAATELRKQGYKADLENFKSYDEAEKNKKAMGEALRLSVMTDMEQILAQEAIYNQALKDQIISAETYGRLMDGLQGKVDALNPSFLDFKTLAGDAANSLADGLANAIVQGNSLADVFKNVIVQLAQMIIKALIFRAISGVLNAVSPGLGTAVTGIAGAKAGGGDVNQGASYLVGEKGPEMFTPKHSGKIMTNGQLTKDTGRTGGGMTNVYNISAPGVSREEFTAGLNRSQAAAVSDIRQNRLRRRA